MEQPHFHIGYYMTAGKPLHLKRLPGSLGSFSSLAEKSFPLLGTHLALFRKLDYLQWFEVSRCVSQVEPSHDMSMRKVLNIRGRRRHNIIFVTAQLQGKPSVFNADNRWKLVSQLHRKFYQRVDTRKPLSWGDVDEEDRSGSRGGGNAWFWVAERERSCRFAATGKESRFWHDYDRRDHRLPDWSSLFVLGDECADHLRAAGPE